MSRRFDFTVSTNEPISPLNPFGRTTFDFGKEGVQTKTGSVGDGGFGDFLSFDYEYGFDLYSELSFDAPSFGSVEFDYSGEIELEFPELISEDIFSVSGLRNLNADSFDLSGRGLSLGGVGFDVVLDHSALSVTDFELLDTVLTRPVYENDQLIMLDAGELRLPILDLNLDGTKFKFETPINGVDITLGGTDDSIKSERGSGVKAFDAMLASEFNIVKLDAELLKLASNFVTPETKVLLNNLSSENTFLKDGPNDLDFYEFAYSLLKIPADISLDLTQTASLSLADFDMTVIGEGMKRSSGNLSDGINLKPTDVDGDGFFSFDVELTPIIDVNYDLGLGLGAGIGLETLGIEFNRVQNGVSNELVNASVGPNFAFSPSTGPLIDILPGTISRAVSSSDINVITQSFRVPFSVSDGPENNVSENLVGSDGASFGIGTLKTPTYTDDGVFDFTVSLDRTVAASQYNIAYIIDVSGSMRGGELSNAKSAYIGLTNRLEANGIADASNFGVIPFNSSASLTDSLTAAEAANEVQGLSAGGGTRFGPALQRAQEFFADAVTGQTNIAYFLSDGRGFGASDALTSLANVQAFGVGGGADIQALSIIDSDDATSLVDSSQLFNELTSSNVDVSSLDRIEISLDGTVIETVLPSQLIEGALGREYNGRISGLQFDETDVKNITAEYFRSDGTSLGAVDTTVARSKAGDQVSVDGKSSKVILGSTSADFDTQSVSTENVDFLGNYISNSVKAKNTAGQFELFDGDDTIFLGETNRSFDRVIDGGPGTDRAIYDSAFDASIINHSGNITRVGSNTDTFSNFEEVWFSDKIYSIDERTTSNRNQAPEISEIDVAPFDENGSGLVFVTEASDPNNDTVLFDLHGSDADIFEISRNSGEVRFKDSPNFEAPSDMNSDNLYEVIVSVSDGELEASKAVKVAVLDVNEAPSAGVDSYTTSFNELLVVGEQDGLLSNDVDPENDELSVIDVAHSSLGTLEVSSDGSFAFTPKEDASGTEVLAYSVSDGIESTEGVIMLSIDEEPSLERIVGSNGNDNLVGTDVDELIQPVGGALNSLTGNGGADVFDFRDFIGNGTRDVANVMDLEVGVDSLGLDRDDVAASRSFAGNTYLNLAGGENDMVVLQGVDSADELIFV